ncbi:MAG: hypothetical protein PVG79_11835 [Gemmatimonadales bacterium]|jgi:Tfp pilus assembly protein PilV
MKRFLRWPRSEAGFSIMTVLVASVVMGVAVIALSGTTVYVLSLQTESDVRATAISLATAYMEEVKTRPIEEIVTESVVAVNEIGVEEESGRFSRALTVTAGPAPRSRLITVRVNFSGSQGRSGKIELITIVYEGVDS